MEYKLIIDGSDKYGDEQKVECSIADDSNKLTIKIGFHQEILIDIDDVKALEDLIGLKDR